MADVRNDDLTPAGSDGHITTEQRNNSAQQNNQQPQQRVSTWGMLQAFAVRMFITYAVFSLFRGNKTPPSTPTNLAPGSGVNGIIGPASNLFEAGFKFDLYAYLSEEKIFDQFDAPLLSSISSDVKTKILENAVSNNSLDMYQKNKNYTENIPKSMRPSLIWRKTGLVYGDWKSGTANDGSFVQVIDFPASQNLMNNGSLYLHVYLVKTGFSPDPKDKNLYSKKFTIYKSKVLTRYKKRKLVRSVNLLTGETQAHASLVASADTPENVKHLPPCTHWHPNLTLNLVDDHTAWTQGSVPSPINQFINFYPATNQYYPVLYLNDYWNLHEEYTPVNETTPILKLRLTYSPISLFRWQLYVAQSMRNSWLQNLVTGKMAPVNNEDVADEKNVGTITSEKASTEGGFQALTSLMGEEENEEEQDAFKKTILETNPYLLAITVIVSIVHSVFEVLAFKNDIQFWRTRESLEGLSVRSVFFNVFQSGVIVLYVLDNDTNFMIKLSVVLGLGIEIWKIKKVVNLKINYDERWFGIIPKIYFEHQDSYVNSETKNYDQMAFRYLSWILFPMLFGYCIYSLMYLEHRGWYSWVLSVLYGFLLIFGFITMTPQLFINYKMKSVAHLPWRMLTYKALNTFIDDLFAFVIRMPTLYRIGCFRDDVIFFIYLYQRWIYPTDPKRRNEFGASQVELQEAERKRRGEILPTENKEMVTSLQSIESDSPQENEDLMNIRQRGVTDNNGITEESDTNSANTSKKAQ